jgi:hypothetical protein|tara:strand:- start:188 stop:334 length:147 start_codon:yes stop_codon:yes gene_type:complete
LPSRIIFCDFPKNAKSIFVNGKKYNREEFEKAKKLELRRGKKGRFIKI